ncbi:terpenoid synthase [Mycena galopus ATCC 62051]|nr:terpenoid synthase [Mycena galopus ATCC 62051]
MSTTNYATCIKHLLTDLGYRSQPLPPYDDNYWGPFHTWMFDGLGPTTSWSAKHLTELEHSAGSYVERAYPYASTDMKILYAKLTALCLYVDDSIEDEAVCAEIMQFSHKLYLGERQQNPMLALYHATLKELSDLHGNNTFLRDLAVLPWISHIDACLIEKQIFTAERDGVVSLPSGDSLQSRDRFAHLEGLAVKFPHYLRSKSGIAEAYAVLVFKGTKEQNLPLARYIRVLPDLCFYLEVMNDLLSFHKEELAGETYNLIHLRTRALSAAGARGSGGAGEWTTYDTVQLLCDEIREAARRIDGLFRLEECEKKMRGETGPELTDLDEVDLEIAKQWRDARDGNISFHLECRRYKLDFLRLAMLGETSLS